MQWHSPVASPCTSSSTPWLPNDPKRLSCQSLQSRGLFEGGTHRRVQFAAATRVQQLPGALFVVREAAPTHHMVVKQVVLVLLLLLKAGSSVIDLIHTRARLASGPRSTLRMMTVRRTDMSTAGRICDQQGGLYFLRRKSARKRTRDERSLDLRSYRRNGRDCWSTCATYCCDVFAAFG
jgi:hypothetical protein